jgi:hypothetical protein
LNRAEPHHLKGDGSIVTTELNESSSDDPPQMRGRLALPKTERYQ